MLNMARGPLDGQVVLGAKKLGRHDALEVPRCDETPPWRDELPVGSAQSP